MKLQDDVQKFKQLQVKEEGELIRCHRNPSLMVTCYFPEFLLTVKIGGTEWTD